MSVDFTADQPGLNLFHCPMQHHMDSASWLFSIAVEGNRSLENAGSVCDGEAELIGGVP